MTRQRRDSTEELALAIDSLRLATNEREGAMPGSEAYDDAFTNEELLKGLVLELVRERNRTAMGVSPPGTSRIQAPGTARTKRRDGSQPNEGVAPHV